MQLTSDDPTLPLDPPPPSLAPSSSFCSLHCPTFLCQSLLFLCTITFTLVTVTIYLYVYSDLLVFVSLVLPVNVVVMVAGGHYVLKGVFFPYSNFFFSRRLDSTINRKFTLEFVKLVSMLGIMVEVIGGIEHVDRYWHRKELLKGESLKEEDEEDEEDNDKKLKSTKRAI